MNYVETWFRRKPDWCSGSDKFEVEYCARVVWAGRYCEKYIGRGTVYCSLMGNLFDFEKMRELLGRELSLYATQHRKIVYH